MDQMRKKSLRKSFFLGMAVTVGCILLLSILAIYGSYRLQKWIMPDSNEVYLEVKAKRGNGEIDKMGYLMEYGRQEQYSALLQEGERMPEVMAFTIKRETAAFAELTPKRKAAYRFLNVMMFLLPVAISAVGVGMCGWWFYRRKLAVPLNVLADATEHICQRDLDFSVNYRSGDELGRLCGSFEEMRQTLCENNKELWGMIENRKRLQMSIAHDLRTPITIIKGYVEFLLRRGIHAGEMAISLEKERSVLRNLLLAAQRLERYTESIRDISQMEETEIRREECSLTELVESMANDFSVLADRQGKTFAFKKNLAEDSGSLDRQCLYRVLENVVANALRHAEREVRLTMERAGEQLSFVIEDDGMGFSAEMLRSDGRQLFYPAGESLHGNGEHLGIGLAVSRILCSRMGGGMRLENCEEGGARVRVWIILL